MHTRVIRNLALIGAMGGAFFIFNSKTAQAQSSCTDQCSTQEDICFADACGDQNPCPPQPNCLDSYQECIAACNN